MIFDINFSAAVDWTWYIIDLKKYYDDSDLITVIKELFNKSNYNQKNKEPDLTILWTNRDEISQILQKELDERCNIVARFFEEFHSKYPFLANCIAVAVCSFSLFFIRLFFFIISLEILIIILKSL